MSKRQPTHKKDKKYNKLLPHEFICSDLPRSFFKGMFSCSACDDWREITTSSPLILDKAEAAKVHIAQSRQISTTADATPDAVLSYYESTPGNGENLQDTAATEGSAKAVSEATAKAVRKAAEKAAAKAALRKTKDLQASALWE
jgi:hypothetical protein